MNRRFRGFTFFELVIVLAILAILVGILYSAYETYRHGGCAERKPTGSMSCWGSEGLMHCEPDTVCVKYGDGTVP